MEKQIKLKNVSIGIEADGTPGQVQLQYVERWVDVPEGVEFADVYLPHLLERFAFEAATPEQRATLDAVLGEVVHQRIQEATASLKVAEEANLRAQEAEESRAALEHENEGLIIAGDQATAQAKQLSEARDEAHRLLEEKEEELEVLRQAHGLLHQDHVSLTQGHAALTQEHVAAQKSLRQSAQPAPDVQHVDDATFEAAHDAVTTEYADVFKKLAETGKEFLPIRKVAELREVLTTLPDEMPVVGSSASGGESYVEWGIRKVDVDDGHFASVLWPRDGVEPSRGIPGLVLSGD